MSKDEKIIQAHAELIETDVKSASGLMSAAVESSGSSKEFAKELPSVQAQVDLVTDKVTEMTTEHAAMETAYREAKIAAAGGDKDVVKAKASEVSDHLGNLKRLDSERKTLFETAEKAAQEKRTFATIVEEIEGIQTDVQGLLAEANKKVATAQQAVDTARAKLPVDKLTGRTKAAVEKTRSMAPSVKGAEVELRDAKNVASTLKPHLTKVNSALKAANTASSSNDKPAADKALESAKTAKAKADKTAIDAGIIEQKEEDKEKEGASKPTPQSPSTAATQEEPETSFIEELLAKYLGRLVMLGLMLFAILLWAPELLRPIFGLAWIILLSLTVIPYFGKKPKWGKAFWVLAGLVLFTIALDRFMPMFTGGESIADLFGLGTPQDPDPKVDPALVPTEDPCRPGWFDDPCAATKEP